MLLLKKKELKVEAGKLKWIWCKCLIRNGRIYGLMTLANGEFFLKRLLSRSKFGRRPRNTCGEDGEFIF
jgi:hypothetical protein